MSLERIGCDQWARVLAPAPGALPPASDLLHPERVLHVALRDTRERQPGLARALSALGHVYADVDWIGIERTHGLQALPSALVQAASAIRPTLVFMQIQRAGVLQPVDVEHLRRACDPSVVIIQWDGDQHHGPYATEREWFRRLGAACDVSLIANTAYLEAYAAQGVRHPGFLPCGLDEVVYRPMSPDPGTPKIVFLANNYSHLPAYDRRREMVSYVAQRVASFGVYGGNWSGPHARPWVEQQRESSVYAGAVGAISMSIDNGIARCTSGRLFRALGSGGCVLVERFPDMEGLGLRDGVNCLMWSTFDELVALCERVQREDMSAIRGAAREMSVALHTWSARMREVMAMVYAVREARRS